MYNVMHNIYRLIGEYPLDARVILWGCAAQELRVLDALGPAICESASGSSRRRRAPRAEILGARFAGADG